MSYVGALGGASPRDDVESSPARQASLRSHNLGVVARTIFASEAPISRAGVAALTGLTRSTVSRLTEELLAARLITELALPDDRRRGRPAVPLAPAVGSIAGMGLEVNVDYVAGRVVDLAGTVVAESLVAGNFEDSDPGEVLPLLGALGRRLLAEAAAAGLTMAGTCLALPGLVDTAAGRLLLAPNLGWRDLAPADHLGPAVLPGNTSLHVANEADLAGFAQSMARPGCPAGEDTFLYLSGGIGVGSAVVERGRVAGGQRGWAGELGHVTIEPDGPDCHCGSRGCLERYAGIAAIAAAAGLPSDTTATELAAAAERDAGARAAVDRAAWALGIALAGAVNLIDVASVALGTGYVPLFPLLEPGITEQLERRVISASFAPVSVRPANATIAAASTGGALRALETVLDAPAAWIEAGAATG
ncbi:ROK family transcriptional regulator [Georgenia sunbinii]|uniref:ROK family transcriptional regulator n=1 Tax=Georgenia sunbinii TaxID=3117728 RepID=UPI002F26D94C